MRKNVDQTWLNNQVTTYINEERPAYEAFGKLIDGLLRRVVPRWDPLATIAYRAKGVASFAEKCLRKEEYDDPVHQLTDLCGARVVVRSDAVVQRVCDFITEHLVIVEHGDLLTRLQRDQFGYRSIHFLVSLPSGDDGRGPQTLRRLHLLPEERALIPLIRAGSRNRVAEIQVRTQLQHAWADVAHDRLYKTGYKIPDAYHREAARLAAILEAADRDFGALMESVDAYQVDLGAHMDDDRRKSDRDTLTLLMKSDDLKKDRPAFASRLARLCRIDGDWEGVVRVVEPFISVDSTLRTDLRVQYGEALCRRAGDDRRSPDLAKGIEQLAPIAADPSPYVAELAARASVLLARAEMVLGNAGATKKAIELCKRAVSRDPDNPYHLAAYIEAELRLNRAADFLPPLQARIDAAIETCRAHALAKAELPVSYFTQGRLCLWTGREHDALVAYAKGSCHATISQLADERDVLTAIASAGRDEPMVGFDHAELLLAIAESARAGTAPTPHRDATGTRRKAEDVLRDAVAPVFEGGKLPMLRPRIAIVAGGASREIEGTLAPYQHLLLEGLRGFSGTVFGGGTTSGVPGQLGAVAATLKIEGRKDFDLYAYLPEMSPSDTERDARYDGRFIVKSGRTFSLGEALRTWAHIILGGHGPEDVRVLAINGGPISELEMIVGLALGARVGILRDSGRAAQTVGDAEPWWARGKRLLLPYDAMTVRAFFHAAEPTSESPAALEAGARYLHETYVNAVARAAQSWDKVDDKFKRSNLHQAAYARQIVESAGFVVRAATGAASSIEFSTTEVDQMAVMEHGRYNVERMLDGWAWGPKRDNERRLHPLLISWEKLSEPERDKDREAVRAFPAVLKAQGLEVVRR